MARQSTAPKYLNLLRIQMPVGAVLSIAHRISGVLLFLSLPFLVYLLGLSLRDETGYTRALEWLASPLPQLIMVVLAWSLFHHLLAGIRHLLLDLHIGVERIPARRSAWMVNLGAIVLSLVYVAGRLL